MVSAVSRKETDENVNKIVSRQASLLGKPRKSSANSLAQSMNSIEIAQEQIQNDLLQNIELEIRIKMFVRKTTCLFVWFILQSIGTSVIRFFTPNYNHESVVQKEILYAYIPL